MIAIFAVGKKNAASLRAALALNWALGKVINPTMLETWPNMSQL